MTGRVEAMVIVSRSIARGAVSVVKNQCRDFTIYPDQAGWRMSLRLTVFTRTRGTVCFAEKYALPVKDALIQTPRSSLKRES